MAKIEYEKKIIRQFLEKVEFFIPNDLNEIQGSLKMEDSIQVKSAQEDIIELTIKRELMFEPNNNIKIYCEFAVLIDNNENITKEIIKKDIKNEKLDFLLVNVFSDISLIIANITKHSMLDTLITLPGTIYKNLKID